jgi:hypothetical protein
MIVKIMCGDDIAEIVDCKKIRCEVLRHDGSNHRTLQLHFWTNINGVEAPGTHIYEGSLDLYIQGDTGKTLDRYHFDNGEEIIKINTETDSTGTGLKFYAKPSTCAPILSCEKDGKTVFEIK